MLENTVVLVNSTAKEYIPWKAWLWKQSQVWGGVCNSQQRLMRNVLQWRHEMKNK